MLMFFLQSKKSKTKSCCDGKSAGPILLFHSEKHRRKRNDTNAYHFFQIIMSPIDYVLISQKLN